jgi:DNA polymerase-3 subunit gamma/tau
MDVIEVDAASRTGVEDIREIIEATQYTPVLGRFKVFIIDEVHMISKSAFNALLKTLEEPPDHVKFVFATTELNKIPETILSRCMIFDLKRVQKSVVCDHLVSTAAKEGFSLDNGAVDVIAEESGGSLRDSLSMLEQAMMLSFQSKKIDYDSVVKMIGGCPLGDCISLIRAVLSANIASAFEKTEFLIMNGASPFAIFKKLQDLIYKLITVKVAKVSDIPQLKDLSQDISLSNLLYLWQILMKQIPNMKNTDHADNVLKAIVIILAHTASFPSIEDLMIKEDENLVAAIKDKFPGSVVTPL